MAGEDSRLALLRAQAEREMRRRLPGDGDRPAAKRRKGAGSGGSGAAAAAADEAADDTAAHANGGRFDYGAVQELGTGVAGFLLTCPLQRENSARKEAAPLLQRYLQQCVPSSSAANADSGSAGGAEGGAGAEGPDGAAAATSAQLPNLAAIKVACRGVVAFKVAALEGPVADSNSSPSSPSPAAVQVQGAVAALLHDIAIGAQPRLRHVQRVIPVQASCQLEPAGLRAAGQQLAALVASAAAAAASGGVGGAAADAAPRPAPAGEPQQEQLAQQRLTFGIALKHRCSEGGGKANAAPASAVPSAAAAVAVAAIGAAEQPAPSSPAAPPVVPAAAGSAGMDRGAIIAAVAAGFEQALRGSYQMEAAVDLKAPDWVLVVEVLPAGGALYAALCAVPRHLCVLKPKLHIQPVGKA